MKASVLINKLMDLVKEHGDKEVFLSSNYLKDRGLCYIVENVELSREFGSRNEFYLIDDIVYNSSSEVPE